jgi:trk system potassium uptake protein TrkA
VIGVALANVRAATSRRSQHGHGAAEALEVVVRGDRKTCKVAGRRIDELKLPEGAQIGAIVRGEDVDADAREVIIPHHDTVIQTGDHVVVFVPRKRMVRDIEKLFQVSALFGF